MSTTTNFNEADHPRTATGRFAPKPGQANTASTDSISLESDGCGYESPAERARIKQDNFTQSIQAAMNQLNTATGGTWQPAGRVAYTRGGRFMQRYSNGTDEITFTRKRYGLADDRITFYSQVNPVDENTPFCTVTRASGQMKTSITLPAQGNPGQPGQTLTITRNLTTDRDETITYYPLPNEAMDIIDHPDGDINSWSDSDTIQVKHRILDPAASPTQTPQQARVTDLKREHPALVDCLASHETIGRQVQNQINTIWAAWHN